MLILTEKPSVAQDIANTLHFSKDTAHGYFVSADKKSAIVAAHGHLLELYKPEDYTGGEKKAWRLEDLPLIPDQMKYKKIPPEPKKPDSLKIIKGAFETFGQDDFVLATDAEREGELIGALILDYVGFTRYDTAKRFWTSEALTPDVIRKALSNAKPLKNYEHYKRAGLARQHADWLVGMNFSRLLSVQSNTLCSFGRVQTAVLGAIFMREKSIAEFQPKPYVQLQVTATKNQKAQGCAPRQFKMILTDKNTDHFAPNDKTLSECKNLLSENKCLKITEIKTERKTENPPQLFDITELQKYCSQHYQFSPSQTLELAQSLYEKHKCLSYPRTPSVVLGDDNVDLFRKKFELLKTAYPKLAQGCAPESISSENKRIFNSAKLTDHHALIPLAALPKEANENEKKVYTAVTKRFFTVIKPPHIYEQTNITAETENGRFTFKTSGKKIIQQGWKESETNTEEKRNVALPEEEDAQVLPELAQGESITAQRYELLQKMTKPQKHYTNATILAMMKNPKGSDDENLGKLAGLGTPATRAKILQGLIDRRLIEVIKQHILITEKGKFLIKQVLQLPRLADLISISTTTKWEQQLQDEPERFLENIKSFIRTELPLMRLTTKWERPFLGLCPLCGGKVFTGKNSYFCENRPKEKCTFSIFKTISGANVTESDAVTLLSGKETRAKKMKSVTGKEFTAKLKIEKGKVIRNVQKW